MALVKNNFEVPDFYWFIGVVEARSDPSQMGRVKVRVMGYHTPRKDILPTEHLPWAVPVQPTTSSLMNGIGESPTGLVEGSIVMGFFADGEDGQQPIILGSIGGLPFDGSVAAFSSDEGFGDPFQKYPRTTSDASDYGDDAIQGNGEPDVSRLARGEAAESHHSFINKQDTRLEDIPRAIAQEVISRAKKDTIEYERTDGDPKSYWSEPNARFGDDFADRDYTATDQEAINSRYPYNNVRETESGHVFEVDDTPNNERIHTYHKSGTYQEIQADGKRTVKVVGDDYEVVVKDKKLFVKGDMDVTVQGTSRIYVKGNAIQEVEGDLVTTVKGDHVTHVEGNHILEVKGDQSYIVEGARGTRIGGKDHETIGGDQLHILQGKKDTQVSGDTSETVNGSATKTVIKDCNVIGIDGYTVASGKKIALGAGTDVVVGASANVDIKGSRIDLNKPAS